jgi:hypothetical protein
LTQIPISTEGTTDEKIEQIRNKFIQLRIIEEEKHAEESAQWLLEKQAILLKLRSLEIENKKHTLLGNRNLSFLFFESELEVGIGEMTIKRCKIFNLKL